MCPGMPGTPMQMQSIDGFLVCVDSSWRGIGIIPKSGFSLNKAYADDAHRQAGQMPSGCDCANIIPARIYPDQCRLYGKSCAPRNTIASRMVSDEGACRICWLGGIRENAT